MGRRPALVSALRVPRSAFDQPASFRCRLRPVKHAESEIVLVLRHGEMPEKGKPLAAAEVALIESWVSQGAKTARAEPAEVPKYFITEEEREFWAFQPIRRINPPTVKNVALV